jgi:hypothetical protein
MPTAAYVQSIVFFVLAAVALFASAGTVALPSYWAYLGIFAAVFVASFLLLDPDLARERMRPGGNSQPLGLKVFSGVLFAHWIVAGLDHGRFHWSDTVPAWLQWLSLVLLAAAYALCLWAMAPSSFWRAGSRSTPGWPRHCSCSSARHSFCTEPLLKIAFYWRNCPAIQVMRPACAGGSFRGFGEARAGPATNTNLQAQMPDSHKTYYGISPDIPSNAGTTWGGSFECSTS